MWNYAKLGLGAVGGTLLTAATALATPAFTVTPPTIDYAGLGGYATMILTGLAAIWLIRKYIKITNRS